VRHARTKDTTMSTSISTLPNSPGLSVTAYVQGGPSAIGVQQDTFVGLLALTMPTGSLINPVAVTEQLLPATLPSPAVIYQFTVPNTAGTYELTVPFKCAVVFASGIAAGGTSGDTLTLKKYSIDGASTTSISNAIALSTANTVFFPTTLDNTGTIPNNVLLAGDHLQVVAAKGGSNCACAVFVTVIPVA